MVRANKKNTGVAKSRAVSELEGNPSDHAPRQEIQFPVVKQVPAPVWVKDKRSREAWAQVAPMLEAAGVLQTADQVTLGRYVNYFAVYLDAHEHVMSESWVQPTSEDGVSIKPTPWMKMMNDASDKLLSMEKEFGMTPGARARMAIRAPDKPKDKEDDLDGSIE